MQVLNVNIINNNWKHELLKQFQNNCSSSEFNVYFI